MSRYGIAVYGVDTYGGPVEAQFATPSFTIETLDYGSFRLQWVTPGGTWDNLRIVRNYYGYPVDVSNGIIVYTADVGEDIGYVIDINQPTDRWIYYTMFAHDTASGEWIRSGNARVFSPVDYGGAARLLSFVPAPFRSEAMAKFMQVLGFSYDEMRNDINSLLDLTNPNRALYDLIPLALTELGLDAETAIEPEQNRRLLRNAVLLYKTKGTQPCIHSLVNALTGWRSVVQVNPSTRAITIYVDSSADSGNFELDTFTRPDGALTTMPSTKPYTVAIHDTLRAAGDTTPFSYEIVGHQMAWTTTVNDHQPTDSDVRRAQATVTVPESSDTMEAALRITSVGVSGELDLHLHYTDPAHPGFWLNLQRDNSNGNPRLLFLMMYDSTGATFDLDPDGVLSNYPTLNLGDTVSLAVDLHGINPVVTVKVNGGAVLTSTYTGSERPTLSRKAGWTLSNGMWTVDDFTVTSNTASIRRAIHLNRLNAVLPSFLPIGAVFSVVDGIPSGATDSVGVAVT